MDNTGKIGIGTDPVAMLTFRSQQNVSDDLGNGANYTIYLRPDHNGDNLSSRGIAFGGNNTQSSHVSASIYHVQQGSPSYGDLVFATRSNGGSINERLRINSIGNIGIGTESPSNKLTVSGNADFSGSVGIGTSHISDTAFRLHVEKGIRTRKVKVDQITWADFVFMPDYKLPSLKQVEEFIKQHGHLPDVPSAQEVKEKGLDLGDNQAVLLKKIEELTLYIIEMKNEMAELKKALDKK